MTGPAHDPQVRIGIAVPVLDEHQRLPDLLDRLSAVLGALPHDEVRVCVADNGSTDGSWELLNSALRHPRLLVARAQRRGPGHARTAAAQSLGRGWAADDVDPSVTWILSCDADNLIDVDHVRAWIADLEDEATASLVTGGYRFDPDELPELHGLDALEQAWSNTVAWCEQVVGVVNPTGANHAVRLGALASVGWYPQPTSRTVGPDVVVAGDDWDLGLRLRLAGHETRRCPIAVTTSARRFTADPVAYLTGSAHDGEFKRVTGPAGTPPGPSTLPPVSGAVRARAVTHFLLKPILLGLGVAEAPLAAALPAVVVEDLRRLHGRGIAAWQRSRDELVYGLLASQAGLADRVGGLLEPGPGLPSLQER